MAFLRWLTIFAGLLLSPLSPGAQAHEASLAVVEFREVRPNVYVGRWTMEPAAGGASVALRTPPHCYLQMPELNCGEKGLVGSLTAENLGTGLSAVMVKVISLASVTRSYMLTSANPVASIIGSGQPSLEAWLEIARTYVEYGIDHILLGADHLLFVFGLIWLVGSGWRLAETITAFTIGHSASLAAAAFGWIGVPERPLNACIALSIVFVGVEMASVQRGERGLTSRFPWAVAGGFGLVHGIGFATALAGLGIEPRLLPPALAFFNIGVEIGQIAFVLLALALIRAHRRLGAVLSGWGGAIPAYTLGSVAMFWFIGRLLRVVAIP